MNNLTVVPTDDAVYEGPPFAEADVVSTECERAVRLAKSDVIMSRQSQISVTISQSTKEWVDQFTESHGLTKNFVVEEALLYFMGARRELPDEAFVPTRLVVENKAFDRIAQLMESPSAPTKALWDLMRRHDD